MGMEVVVQHTSGTNVEHPIGWGIRRKLTFAFGSLMLLTVFVSGITLFVLVTVVNTGGHGFVGGLRQNFASDSIDVGLLKARQYEKSYLLEYQENGLSDAHDEHVTGVQQQLIAIRDSLSDLSALAVDAGDEAGVERIRQLENLIDLYEENFLTVASKLEERGSRDRGLEGEFNAVALDLEEQFGTDAERGLEGVQDLQIVWLNLRRAEKDYLLYGEMDRADEVRRLAQMFKSQLVASSIPTISISNYRTLVDQYVAAFDAVVDIDREVDRALNAVRDSAGAVAPLVNLVRLDGFERGRVALVDTGDGLVGVLMVLGIGIVVSVGLGITVAVVTSRNISNPVRSLTDAARVVASGDLNVEAPIASKDETAILAGVFNQMITRLREMLQNEQNQRQHLEKTIALYVEHMVQLAQGNLSARVNLNGHTHGGDADSDPLIVLGRNLNESTASLQRTIMHIRDASGDLNSAAAEIQAATAQQASGASEQSAAISQTTTTVDEVKTISEQAIVRLREVAEVAQRTVEVSRGGQRAVTETIESMMQIKQRVEGIAENILALSEQTQQIGEITATVNEIAAQSNILALNAAVEAARAGEHGRGFAVVAMEVRNLAEQSRQATAQIKVILSDIQKATKATVMAMEEGTAGVDQGVMLAAQAQHAIEELAAAIQESVQAATQVVVGGQQQASGIEQIALAMQNINRLTLQSLAGTRQTERSAHRLNVLSRNLNEMVTLYRL